MLAACWRLDVVNGAVWTPLILLYFFRAWRGERPLASAALCGFWLGIAWLCGHHEIPLMVSFTLLFGWIYCIFSSPTSKIQHPKSALLTFLIAGLVIFVSSRDGSKVAAGDGPAVAGRAGVCSPAPGPPGATPGPSRGTTDAAGARMGDRQAPLDAGWQSVREGS